jgi:hypothetical protein
LPHRYSVLEDNIILDPNESNDNNVDELNESKRDETQHKERPVNRDNAGGGIKGKAELLYRVYKKKETFRNQAYC